MIGSRLASGDLYQNGVPEIVRCGAVESFPGLSRDVTRIAKGSSGYFQKDEFSGDYATRDDFVSDWYGKHLNAMQEPSLVSPGDFDKEVYRFLWLRTFNRPIAVRVERSFERANLIVTELSGAGGYEPGNVLRRETISITDKSWCDFIAMLEVSRFWELGGPNMDEQGLDGASWILEGVREGRYHLVERWSPQDGDYRKYCIFLLRISGFYVEKLGDELY